MKRVKPTLTYTVKYMEQEAPPELRERALRIYAQWLIDAWKREQNIKKNDPIAGLAELVESDSEDW